jgi:hypothetical protein
VPPRPNFCKIAQCRTFAAPVADGPHNLKSLLVEANRLLNLTQCRIGKPHVTQRIPFSTLVTNNPRHLKVLLVEANCPLYLAQRVVGIPYIAQCYTFAIQVANSLRGRVGGFHPHDLHARVQAKAEDERRIQSIVNRQLLRARTSNGPGLTGDDVRQIGIKQGQAAQHVLAALAVQIIRRIRQPAEVAGVALVGDLGGQRGAALAGDIA